MNNYFKPTLKNLSQGARLEYVRKLRYMSKDDVADYFELGGERKERTISRYENNSRVPSNERLKELLFGTEKPDIILIFIDFNTKKIMKVKILNIENQTKGIGSLILDDPNYVKSFENNDFPYFLEGVLKTA